MILLTEKERQLLKESASNISPYAFQRLTPSERRDYWNILDRTIHSLMLTHPNAFTKRAVEEMDKKMRDRQSYSRY